MIRESNNQAAALPDRKEITLCEAVTTYVCGTAYDLRRWHQRDEALTEEQIVKLNDILERLQSAAHAGHIKFRAVKEYGDPADGFKDIDPLYFYVKPYFNWIQDVIFHREDEASTVWNFVHLDREQFASLLRDMDRAVQQDQDADLTYDTGLPGRPTSKHFLMPEARRRLEAEDHAKTLSAFSKELAAWLEFTKPLAAQPKPRTIENAIRDLFNDHQKVCTK